MDTHHYSNGEVTVVWQPGVCIHSSFCWRELNEVFNPKERPWIKMDAAATGRIIEQVRRCPSGALSYFLNNQTETKPAETTQATGKVVVAEAAHITKVVVSTNGPYLIDTECRIIHSDGREETRAGQVALCRCGASQNKPYCDGSHEKVGFAG